MGPAGHPGAGRGTMRPMRTSWLATAGLLAALLAIPAGPHAAPAARTVAARGPHAVLPWIEDEYPRAVAEAKARKLPLFVESWAPW